MRFVAFFALAWLAACTNQPVKMTGEETKKFHDERPSAYDLLNKNGLKSIVTANDYCDTTGRCWDVECHGNTSEVTCWKTPTALSEAVFNAKINDEAHDPEAFLASCESPQEAPAKRRVGCFEYLTTLQKYPESTLNADAPRILKLFCDMKDVTCTKNYRKFGKGHLNTDGMGSSIRKGLYQVVSKKTPEATISYEYLILK